MPDKKEPKGLIAFADFDGCKAGDIFTPPAGWKRDLSFDEFRSVEKRRGAGNNPGIAFIDPTGRRHILPVQEA